MEGSYSDFNQYLRTDLIQNCGNGNWLNLNKRPCWDSIRDPLASEANPWTAGLRYLPIFPFTYNQIGTRHGLICSAEETRKIHLISHKIWQGIRVKLKLKESNQKTLILLSTLDFEALSPNSFGTIWYFKLW